MAPPPRTLVLFDIDWTLLNFAADREVLRDVIATFTDDAVLHALDPTGRSDVWVVAQLAEAAGEPPEAVMLRYAESYHARLDAALALHGAQPLPGARALLDHLAATEGVTLGIATGNLRANAALKLRAADLEGFFDPLCGGFGEDGPGREGVVAAALEDLAHGEAGHSVLVGDTELDVIAAQANAVRAIGIATGRHSEAELAAAGAAATFADLSDTPRVANAILGGAA